IPSHKSKKSPYELFKNASISLNFFKQIGNPVAVLLNQKKSKLEPRGDFGKLIGLNPELKSYCVSLDDGRIVNSKNVKFLDFNTKDSHSPDFGELTVEQKTEPRNPLPRGIEATEEPEDGYLKIKQEEEVSKTTNEFATADESSIDNDVNVVEILAPSSSNPVGRILQDRTLQAKPLFF
ncbi:hypothetical protein VP01_7671g2, partial [Puccinia sorghi]